MPKKALWMGASPLELLHERIVAPDELFAVVHDGTMTVTHSSPTEPAKCRQGLKREPPLLSPPLGTVVTSRENSAAQQLSFVTGFVFDV